MADRKPRTKTPQSVNPTVLGNTDLAAFLECIGDGISIQDTGYRVLFQNGVHRRITGEHLGEHCYRAYALEEDICPNCPVTLAFQDGGVHTRERQVTLESGTRSVEITASPLRNQDGEIFAAIEVVRDIARRKRAEEQRELLIAKLEEALTKVRTMEGLLPTCAACHRIRDSEGRWKQFEEYIRANTRADFTHGICPDCAKRLYPEHYGRLSASK